MSLVKWRKRNTDPFRELFEMDHPFWGMSLFPLSEMASSSHWEMGGARPWTFRPMRIMSM